MLSGPFRIPGLLTNGPRMLLGYQHADQHSASTHSALVPALAQRQGDFSGLGVSIQDPFTGQPFPGNVIPSDRISPQAASLVAYYPLPNVDGLVNGANYQAPLLTSTTRDQLQLNLTKSLNPRTTLDGAIALQRTVTDAISLFGFEDRNRLSSITASANWSRRFTPRLAVRLRYQFTRTATTLTPFFANRTNVSGDAGIAGNDQDPANWGPPALAFPSVADLDDGERQQTTRQSHSRRR